MIYSEYESEVIYEDSKIDKSDYLDEIEKTETSHTFNEVQKDGMILELLDIQAKEVAEKITKTINETND